MKKIGLVITPWATVSMPSIALGLLKSVLEENDIKTDVHYLNIDMAKKMDIHLYEEISGSTTYASEWLFSQYMEHANEIKNHTLDVDSIIFDTLDDDFYLYSYLNKNKDGVKEILLKIIPSFLEEVVESIRWNDYALLGFTCMVGYQIPSLVLASMIKEKYPKIKILFGGPNVREKTGEEILKAYPFVDYIIDGEGEIPIVELSKKVLKGIYEVKIPGVIERIDNKIFRMPILQNIVDINELPTSNYDEYYKKLEESRLKGSVPLKATIESSRGCWWGEKCQCSFCGLNNGYLEFREKDSKKVLDELVMYYKKYGVKKFFATDLILSTKLLRELFPMIQKEKLDFEIFYEVKPNMKSDDIRLMKESGIKMVQAGIESLNTDLLKLLRKGVSAIRNMCFLKWCKEYDIDVSWNLLYRIPGEKYESYKEMFKVFLHIIHLQPASGGLIQIALDRFSPYYVNTERYGIKDILPKGVFKLAYANDPVDINNISYSFDFTYDNADETMYMYIEKLATYMEIWNQAYRDNKYYFKYSVEDNVVKIKDYRPDNMEDNFVSLKKYILKDIEKEIFLLCNDVISLKEIELKLEFPHEIIESIIRDLVEKKLLFCEKNLYVNFAVKE